MLTRSRGCFLLAFNALTLTAGAMKDFMDGRQEILNWYSILPGQIFLVSDNSVQQLGHLFRTFFPRQLFIVTAVDPQASDGWLPKDVWDFINQPQPPNMAEAFERGLGFS